MHGQCGDHFMEYLLKPSFTVSTVFAVCASAILAFYCYTLAAAFPTSLYIFQKHFGLSGDHFVKYVVCPRCHTLYELKKCSESSDVLRTTHKSCTFIPFPKNPQVSKRKPCSHQLFKEIVLHCGKKSFYPLKVYCYKSLNERLAKLLERDVIIDLCEYWRIAEINRAHTCLSQFCESCVSIYGHSAATINMHLNTHLKECFIDFGPIYSFWLFSFECYNGLLGSYHTNQRSIEI